MFKKSLGMKRIAVKSAAAALIIAVTVVGFASATDTRSASVSTGLYTQKLIGASLIKEKNGKRAVTREELAEILVRAYIREKRTSIDRIDKDGGVKDSTNPYVLAASKLGFIGSSKGVFSPSKPVSRQSAAYAIMALAKTSTGYGGIYSAYGPKAKPQKKIADMKSVAGYASGSVTLSVNAGIIATDSKGLFRPNAGLGVSDAILATERLAALLELKGDYGESISAKVSKKYDTTVMSGYEVPKRQFTDLSFYSRTGNDLIIEFNGVVSANKGLGVSDIHTQIAAIVKSGGVFSDADVGALVEYIDTKWGSTSRIYSFSSDVYIKNGALSYSAPQPPYIKVSRGTGLFIEMPVKGNAK